MRFRVELIGVFLWLCVLFAAPGSAVAAPAPTQVTIDPAFRAGSATVYRLHVQVPGSPVLALLPDTVHVAALVVNGTVVQRTGRDVDLGLPPFGHAASVLRIAGLTANDTVEIRVDGAAGRRRS